MKLSFWIKRFVVMYCAVFAVLTVAGLLRNRSLQQVLAESAVWAGVTAVVFVTARYFQAKRGQHCALCRDTPEMAKPATHATRGLPRQ